MKTSELKKKISKAPLGPGVYVFINKDKKALYIGKASSIKRRLSSYLKTADQRINKMIDIAQDIRFLKTDSEIEALIMESQLIKKQRPDFNIMLRDDKQYFYVAFTEEKYPHIFVTHQPQHPKNLKRKTWNMDHDTKNVTRYGFHDSRFIGPFTDGTALRATLRYLRKAFPYCTCGPKHNNFCLNYHIGNCPGYCCLKNPNIKNSDKKEYLKNIRNIRDILSGKRSSTIKNLESEMKLSASKGNFQKAIELRNKITRIEKIFENAKIIRNLSISDKPLVELKKILKTKNIPQRIEGYDVSNIQGNFSVGAMVLFVEGVPDKSGYRKFKILTRQSSDDAGMLKEIITRRFKHKEWQYPDLIIVDGGKGQVNAVLQTLYRLKINISVIGLTKNERHTGSHIFINKSKTLIPLSRLPQGAKNLILKIDSEAHRFAISFYRKTHKNRLLS